MIIRSLLDTDLYKFTMMQAVLHQFPSAHVEYQFRCRSEGVDLRDLAGDVQREIDALCTLRFADDELDYLAGLRYIKNDFVEFLRMFRLQSRFVDVHEADNQLAITIRGPWLHTIMFEVPVLAIVSELYHRRHHHDTDLDIGRQRLAEKTDRIAALPDAGRFRFVDFGTRRRFSRDWHAELLATMHSRIPDSLRGSSNVLLARELGVTPIGTMAHEFVQACQQLGPRLRDSQRFAFDVWAREYRGDLGIALSDTYSLEAFLRDFDMFFCKLFDGARQDSGDPFVWTDAVIQHYKRMRVDPATKNLVYSDSLSFERAIEIFDRYKDQVNVSFGIGTHLTNDVGPEPLDMVIKMTACNGQPVAKLSDSPGKAICEDESYLEYVRQAFDIT